MKSESELERILRNAPRPKPPASLSDRLLASFKSAAQDSSGGRSLRPARMNPWKRWLPLIVPAVATAAFSAALVVQHAELEGVRNEIQQLRDVVTPVVTQAASEPVAGGLPDLRAEIERLRELAESLGRDVEALESIAAENEALQQAIIAFRHAMPPEMKAMGMLSEKADSIRCVNNLKQLGLAVRIFATDNEDRFPTDLLSLKNELSVTTVLVCPSDGSRHAATDWDTLTPANISYEFLSPGPAAHEFEPRRVMWRCPVHGHITLCDGSVQMSIAQRHPDWLVTRDGGVYLEPPEAPAPGDPAAATQGGVEPDAVEVHVIPNSDQNAAPFPGVPPEIARRYGVTVVPPEPTPNLEPEPEL
jgi:hypothetical protein